MGRFFLRFNFSIRPPKILVAAICLSVVPFTSACAQQRTRTVEPSTTKNSSQSGLQNANLVHFPSAEVEFIIGPQLKAGSKFNPVPWFDQNAFDRGLSLCAAFPNEAHAPG